MIKAFLQYTPAAALGVSSGYEQIQMQISEHHIFWPLKSLIAV